jgi:cell division protein DivIC
MIKNALLLFFICAAVLVFFLPSYLKMQELSQRNQAYDRKIADLEKSNVNLGDERKMLSDDPEYLERVAREKFGIIKDDEVIYKVVQPGQKRTASSSDATAGLLKKPMYALAEDIDPFLDNSGDVVVAGAVGKKKTSATTKKKTGSKSTTTVKKSVSTK